MDSHVADKVARLLELPTAEAVDIVPDALPLPGPHKMFPDAPIFQPVGQNHLGLSSSGSQAAGWTCDCRLDCLREDVSAFNLSLHRFLTSIRWGLVISLVVREEAGDVGVKATNTFEDPSTLLALEPLVPVRVVHSQYVCPQVAPLGELHTAEAPGVGLLSGVPKCVCVQGLFLGENFATLATLVGAHSSVDPLVSDQLTWLAEFLATKLKDDLKAVSRHGSFSFLYQLQA